jgi:hypothetical protein
MKLIVEQARRGISGAWLLARYFNACGNFVLVIQAALRPTA